MKIIVTGGAGFIGSHLVERLLLDKHEVLVLDNFSTGREQNLAHLKQNKALRVKRVDVSDFQNIKNDFNNIDWVFHLAGLADIVPSVQNPMDYHHSNVDGTFSVLESSRLANVKKVVYAASASCYGIPDVYPTPETAAIKPQYPYALTKNIGEQIVMHWGLVYKLPVVPLRLFNVYGPRSRTSGAYGAVFGVFLAQKLAGKPLTIVGDGNQTRDFTFVTDVAEAMVRAAESRVSLEPMNVGSGSSTSVNRIAELIGGKKVYLSKRPGEPENSSADITKIKKLLNWSPEVSIEEGVAKMLENIDYWRGAPVWTVESINEATKDWFKYLS